MPARRESVPERNAAQTFRRILSCHGASSQSAISRRPPSRQGTVTHRYPASRMRRYPASISRGSLLYRMRVRAYRAGHARTTQFAQERRTREDLFACIVRARRVYTRPCGRLPLPLPQPRDTAAAGSKLGTCPYFLIKSGWDMTVKGPVGRDGLAPQFEIATPQHIDAHFVPVVLPPSVVNAPAVDIVDRTEHNLEVREVLCRQPAIVGACPASRVRTRKVSPCRDALRAPRR